MYKDKLRGLKINSQVEEKKSFYKFIVFGDSSYCCDALDWAIKKYGVENVCWLSDRELASRFIDQTLPSTVRGTENIEIFNSKLEMESVKTTSLFYKEMRFRPFSGRSKSMPLLTGESFYGQDAQLTINGPGRDQQQIDALFNSHKIVHIEKIVKAEATDLINKTEWEIFTSNHEVISCENLIWGGEPLSFHSLVEDKGDFVEIPNFLLDVESLSQLYISLVSDKEVTDSKDTFFIPLSFSQEEGHFIGQFFAAKDGQQRMDFVHFFDEGKYNEDAIIRKIKTLKRNLKKIYELDKRSSFVSEYYSLRKIDVVESYNDKAVEAIFDKFPTLFWIGENAPLKLDDRPFDKISHFVRGALSLQQFFANFK